MIDFNGDGKVDYKDHAMFENMIETSEKNYSNHSYCKRENRKGGTITTETNGAKKLLLLFVVYFVLRLLSKCI